MPVYTSISGIDSSWVKRFCLGFNVFEITYLIKRVETPTSRYFLIYLIFLYKRVEMNLLQYKKVKFSNLF